MDMVWFVLWAMLPVSGCTEHIPITGNCSNDVNEYGERLEVSGKNKTHITCNVFKSEDCGLLPPRFYGDSIGKPRQFEVSYITVNRTVGIVPVAVFKWKPPYSEVDAMHLKGFHLEIRKLHGLAEHPETSCRIFDLTGNTFQGSDNNLKFSVIFPGLGTGPDSQYRATVCSLPSKTHCLRNFFSLPKVQSKTETPANWSPLITHRFSRNSNFLYDLEVTFTLAPTEYKFEEYWVRLYKMSDHGRPLKQCKFDTQRQTACSETSHLVEENPTYGTVTFEDIPENRYMLEVQAYDTYWRYDNKALCYSVQESGRRLREECLRTRIKDIIIGNAEGERPGGEQTTPISPSTNDNGEKSGEEQATPISPSTNDNEIKTLIIAAGTCLCGVVLFAVIFIVISTRKMVQVKEEKVPMRKVYLLAYDDHGAHANAVEALATLLNKHCHCDVIYPKWFVSDILKTGLYEWIVTQIDKSDFVVLVNSKAAYWTYTAQTKGKYFRAGENDPFSFSTSHLRSKEATRDFLYTAIMTYFNYTDSNDVIPFNPGLQYKLPENITDLVNHIHGCNKGGLGKNSILNSAEGKAFVKAVDEAKAYQQKCPDWFSARVPESVHWLVLNPESKCAQVEGEPDNAAPSRRPSSILPYTNTLSETQAFSVDGDEAVTLVLEDEKEFPIHDEPGPASDSGMTRQSSQFSPEYLYPPESYSESLCTEEIEDRIFAISSKAF
ncbi:uncharacterized protein [Haliotis asinina]|uniref:uncharacterized protein n=1 Tax=Haliotis asinina TaxID=109174 RepID=UPI0035317F26